MRKTQETILPDFNPQLVAPCGIDCAACAGFLRKKNPCRGCLSEGTDKGTHLLTCRIKLCAASQGFLRCAECVKLPCARFRNLESRYSGHYGTSLLENSKQIRDRGIKAFMNSERLKWICPSCGKRLAIQSGECPFCLQPNPHFHFTPQK